jgi:hypothetical protein
MGRILYIIGALVVFYLTYKVGIKAPLGRPPAFLAGYFTGLSLFASAGVYCLFKASSWRA